MGQNSIDKELWLNNKTVPYISSRTSAKQGIVVLDARDKRNMT
jgi:hypothetical protein